MKKTVIALLLCGVLVLVGCAPGSTDVELPAATPVPTLSPGDLEKKEEILQAGSSHLKFSDEYAETITASETSEAIQLCREVESLMRLYADLYRDIEYAERGEYLRTFSQYANPGRTSIDGRLPAQALGVGDFNIESALFGISLSTCGTALDMLGVGKTSDQNRSVIREAEAAHEVGLNPGETYLSLQDELLELDHSMIKMLSYFVLISE